VNESIGVDEWLTELTRLEQDQKSKDGAEGFSVEDLAKHRGVGHRAAAYLIHEWCVQNLVEYAGRRRTINVTGCVSNIPVYRLKRGKK
jgi:hypothetical protein